MSLSLDTRHDMKEAIQLLLKTKPDKFTWSVYESTTFELMHKALVEDEF